MRFKIVVVDISIPVWAKALLVGAVPSLLFFSAAYVRADGNATFKPGDPLSATQLNTNFDNLDGRLKAVEGRQTLTVGTLVYSVGPTKFVKATVTAVSGNLGGYTGAKLKCQSEVGTATAHLCTAEEVVRSTAVGAGPNADGWIATGAYAAYDKTDTHFFDDCSGYQTDNSASVGMTWNPNGSPNDHFCSEAHPLLCCD